MGLSLWHIIVVLIVVLVIFGAGRLPNVMGDLGKGVRNFKAGLEGKDEKAEEQPKTLADKSKDDDGKAG